MGLVRLYLRSLVLDGANKLPDVVLLGIEQVLVARHRDVLVGVHDFLATLINGALDLGLQIHDPLHQLEHHVLQVGEELVAVHLLQLIEALLHFEEAGLHVDHLVDAGLVELYVLLQLVDADDKLSLDEGLEESEVRLGAPHELVDVFVDREDGEGLLC